MTRRSSDLVMSSVRGISVRSQQWFDIELDLIEVNFSTCEPDYYKKKFQRHDDT